MKKWCNFKFTFNDKSLLPTHDIVSNTVGGGEPLEVHMDKNILRIHLRFTFCGQLGRDASTFASFSYED